MKIKQKITMSLLGIPLMLGIAALPSTLSYAAEKCGGAETAIIKCDATNSKDKGVEDNGVWALLLMAINILTAGIGIAAVGGLIFASILYASASDNEGQIKKAKDIIQNVIIGLIAYVGMYALIQFIIPGGVFS